MYTQPKTSKVLCKFDSDTKGDDNKKNILEVKGGIVFAHVYKQPSIKIDS